MHSCISRAGFALLVVVAIAAPAAAQGPPPGPPKPPVPEPTLVFDREVFTYHTQARRDPFTTLVGKAGLGPRFEELTLKGIIYSGEHSVALLTDAIAKKVYRARKGDVVGNARVVEIGADRVIFAVENFGQYRQEVIELKRKPEGAK
jgi:hypothetical protein